MSAANSAASKMRDCLIRRERGQGGAIRRAGGRITRKDCDDANVRIPELLPSGDSNSSQMNLNHQEVSASPKTAALPLKRRTPTHRKRRPRPGVTSPSEVWVPAMSGRATHGSFYTVGLVSTPAPQHLSSTTTATTASASTFTGTYTTTPMQHLASMSSGHTLPPLSFVSDAATLAPPRLTASNTPPPSSSPPSFASPPTISGSPPPSSSVSSSFVPSPSSSALEPPVSLAVSSTPPSFPRYGRGGSTFSSRLTATTRPGVMTTLTRPSVVTTRSPGLATLTTHGPTVTTYTTYNPALNKFTTHTPVTTTSLPSASSSSSSPHPSSAFLRYTPTSSRFVSLTTTTTTVTPPPRQAPTVYTLSPNLADNAGPSSAEPGANFPPPPKVTLASTSTLHRPGPAWPLRVTLGASEGYDNLHLDVGEEEAAPKPQVRTHMTKEEFLAAPQPGLELLETGDKGKAACPPRTVPPG
ncbi:hypothetical protein E2C01_022628 [Portunus trituberculatus]|uniref:Uncharacterized protein n=1 Tax=Portunus trituberculatus TaxID=210409 RepID=A0A5B7E6I0_PORTR|nr:hypothetical protein [Portunus trituberculatus]